VIPPAFRLLRAYGSTLLLAWVALSTGVPAAADPLHGPLRLVRIQLAQESDGLWVRDLGLDLLGRERGVIEVAVSDREIDRLLDLGLEVAVVEGDLEAAQRRRLGPAADRYHTFAEVEAELQTLHRTHPELVGEPIAIGESWEGRPIWAVKISDHPERDEGEPAVLFDALHHAREPMGMESLLYAMQELVRSYPTDPDLRALIDERELWFVPVVNPDGYVFGGIGGMWRKNRRPNPDGSFGVDLNRNYSYRWGADDLGSSPLPASPTYRGPAPFSEPESQALRDFIRARRFAAGMTLHAFADVNLLPTGFDRAPEIRDLYARLARDLERLTGYPHGQPQEILYPSNGRSQDWQAHEAGMVVVEPEIGSAADGFWPPPARIEPLARRLFPALVHVARLAGPHLVFRTLSVADPDGNQNGHADPGEHCALILELANEGLAPSSEAVLRVTRTAPGLLVGERLDSQGRGRRSEDLVFRVPPLRKGGSCRLTATPLPIAVHGKTAPGQPLAVTFAIAGGSFAAAELVGEVRPGTPRCLTGEGPGLEADAWDFGPGWGVRRTPRGTPSGRGDWVATASSRPAPEREHRGARSTFSDSPNGCYPPSSDRALTLRQPISLAGIEHAELVYREQFQVEPWEDRCLVEARTALGDWEPLLVVPGGVETGYRERRLSLDRYAGADRMWLRFRLVANATVEREGWTVGQIQVWGYSGQAIPSAVARRPEVPLLPAPTTSTPSSAAE
jgi:hypothetical protein